MELGNFRAHGDAHLGAEIGERLVEEEYLGLADDGTADGDALTLTTGEGLWLAVKHVGEAEDLGGFVDALLDFGARELTQLEAESHLIEKRHVRVERVVLENHRDATVLRLHVVDDAVADLDGAAGDLLEAGEHA